MSTEKPLRPIKAAGPSLNKINTLMELAGRKPAGPKQRCLDLDIERQTEINGLEMPWNDTGCNYSGSAMGAFVPGYAALHLAALTT